MQERETGKQRSQRIQIDYYRHKGGLDALKWACILAALIGAGLYTIYVLAAGGGSHVSTGPVALVHTSFENQCYECHQDLSPIAADAARPDIDFLGVSVNKPASIQHIETACQKCHHVGDHYRDLMKQDWQWVDQNCASCHSEHQGRDFDLTLVSKEHCVSCHANLSDVCTSSPRVKADTVAFNQADHGDFASLIKGDPGVVKFDHHQHMLPGQVDKGKKGAFTIGMLEPTMRESYRVTGQDDAALVTLDCSSCHELADSPESNISQTADSELGRHIKPISFDQHCSACHSINPTGRTEDTLPLPHAAPWSEIDLLLQAKIAGRRATGKMRLPRDDSQSTPQPGFGSGTPATLAAVATASEVAAARKLIEATCLECHDAASITDQAIVAGRNGTAAPMIPGRFFIHGLYDHAAHRKIDCRYCHEAAYPSIDASPKPPTDQQTVMIAGIDSCAGCHRDADTPTPDDIHGETLLGGQSTWASDNCTLCHRYHTLPPLKSQSLPLASIGVYTNQFTLPPGIGFYTNHLDLPSRGTSGEGDRRHRVIVNRKPALDMIPALLSLRLDPPGGQRRSGFWNRDLRDFGVATFARTWTSLEIIHRLATIATKISATALPSGRVKSTSSDLHRHQWLASAEAGP